MHGRPPLIIRVSFPHIHILCHFSKTGALLQAEMVKFQI
jgi:hypothetical protein